MEPTVAAQAAPPARDLAADVDVLQGGMQQLQGGMQQMRTDFTGAFTNVREEMTTSEQRILAAIRAALPAPAPAAPAPTPAPDAPAPTASMADGDGDGDGSDNEDFLSPDEGEAELVARFGKQGKASRDPRLRPTSSREADKTTKPGFAEVVAKGGPKGTRRIWDMQTRRQRIGDWVEEFAQKPTNVDHARRWCLRTYLGNVKLHINPQLIAENQPPLSDDERGLLYLGAYEWKVLGVDFEPIPDSVANVPPPQPQQGLQARGGVHKARGGSRSPPGRGSPSNGRHGAGPSSPAKFNKKGRGNDDGPPSAAALAFAQRTLERAAKHNA